MLSTNDQMGSGSVLCTRVAAVAGGLGSGAPACGGGAPNGANSANCESGCQVPIPSRHPISLRTKRPLRKPVADFFFRENAQTRCAPAKVEHDAGLLAKCAAKGNLKGKRYRWSKHQRLKRSPTRDEVEEFVVVITAPYGFFDLKVFAAQDDSTRPLNASAL